MSLEKSIKAAERLRQEIKDRQALLADVELEISQKACPYAAGDRLRTNRGLGQHGLVVDAIIAPPYPSWGSLWALRAWAISKSGEVTKRSVTLYEYHLTTGLVITKE